MVACGIDSKYSDEDGLQNVYAFSSAKGQHSVASQEGLYVKDTEGNTLDRRYPITFDDKKFSRASCVWLGQVTVETKVGKAIGTGITIKTPDGECLVLSCAHNFVGVSVTGDKVNFHKPLFYCMRHGENNWSEKFLLNVNEVRVHPSHNGNPASGFDIAVCSVTQKMGPGKVNPKQKIQQLGAIRDDAQWYRGELYKKIKKGLSIEIAGYPAEKNKRGYPYAQTGVIKEVSRTKEGGYLLWHNVDTTPGNSGSPIFVTDKSFLQIYRDKWKAPKVVDKVIVGVHTGSDPVRGMNFGTLITDSLSAWIRKEESSCRIRKEESSCRIRKEESSCLLM